MTECKQHGVPMQARQVDTSTWKELCPICEYQAGEILRVSVEALLLQNDKLKERVRLMWERLGMPVEGYERGPILPE